MDFGTILENVNHNPPQFTKREKDVIDLLMQGMSNKQIAAKLVITGHTVEFHLKNIYAKLGVSSRTEAILVLGKILGSIQVGKPGESTVDRNEKKEDNRGDRKKVGWFFNKSIILILAAFSLILLFPVVFSKPKGWEKYERECEYPDEASVGQVIDRSNASEAKVHGQFGTTGEAPWDAKEGDVIYRYINIPEAVSLFLQLRYSKSSSAGVPILVYLDDEQAPRASIYPKDLGNWDQFAWTESVYLGRVKRGVHALRFFTQGQQYGVADLDQFILTSQIP